MVETMLNGNLLSVEKSHIKAFSVLNVRLISRPCCIFNPMQTLCNYREQQEKISLLADNSEG